MTTNYHTAITSGAAANAAVINAPLAALDSAIGTAMAASLLAQEAILTGGTAATLADGAAAAAQKVVTVDDATVFVAGATVEYALVGGVIETNTVDTVDSGTQITLTTNIGTGGIPDDGLIAVVPPAYANMRAGVYNVRDYGATGDGTTDDATAIQAAITAAATTGGVVYLPAGTYLVNAELQVKDDVSLVGQGIGATTITTGATLANGVINIWQSGGGAGSGADRVTLRDFTLDANGAARIGAALGGYVRGIRSLYGPEDLLIQRVAVEDGGERAIEIYQPVRCRVTDCIVTNASTTASYEGDGIHIEGTAVANGTARNIVIEGCLVEKWGDSAIAVTACTEVVVANNVLRGKAAFSETPTAEESGIDMTGVQEAVCTGNKIYQVKYLAVNATDNVTGSGFASVNVTISNNVIVGDAATTADYGIKLGGAGGTAGCGNYVVTGNVITNTYHQAIGLEAPCANVTISGNTITDACLEGDGSQTYYCGIMLGVDYSKNASGVLCCGNTIVDTGSHIDSGVYVNAANTNNVVYGNLVAGASVTADVVWAGGELATAWNTLNVMKELRVGGDVGGKANYVTLTNTVAQPTSSGTGTVKMNGATNRDSIGFLKLYNGTSAIYVPFWDVITG